MICSRFRFVFCILICLNSFNGIAFNKSDSSYFNKYIIKFNPLALPFEPAFYLDYKLQDNLWLSLKGGYKPGLESKDDRDWTSYNLFQYFRGPVIGLGIKAPFPNSKNNSFLNLQFIYKHLFVNKANVSYDMGERNEYMRSGGYTNSFTLKLLFSHEWKYKFFMSEFYVGAGLKFRDNYDLWNLGWGEIEDNGNVLYNSRVKDYNSMINHDNVERKEPVVFPTLHIGFNIGIGQ